MNFDGIFNLKFDEEIHKYEFDSRSLSNLYYDNDSDGIAAVVETYNEYVLYVESALFGNMKTNVKDKPIAIAKNNKNIYILFENYIYKYDIKSNVYQKMLCSSGAEDILISSEDSIIVCYPSYAINLNF